MKMRFKGVLFAAVAAIGLQAQAEVYTLAGSNTSQSSMNGTGNAGWKDSSGETVKGHIPSSGNEYIVDGEVILRTPSSSAFTFGGDKLTLTGGAEIRVKISNGGIITIPKLVVTGAGRIFQGDGNTCKSVAGSIDILETGLLKIDVSYDTAPGAPRQFDIQSDLTGTGLLWLGATVAGTATKNPFIKLSGLLAEYSGKIVIEAGNKGPVETIFESIPGDPSETMSDGLTVDGNAILKFMASGEFGYARGIDFGTASPEIYVEEGQTVLIDGLITGAAGFRKTGAGTLALCSVSSGLTGEVTVAAGTLQLCYAQAKALPNAQIKVLEGATLDENGPICSVRDMLSVDASPARYGEVSPAYGTTNGLAAGDSFTCSAPAFVEVGSFHMVCTGYQLYKSVNDEWVAWGEPQAGNSFTYTHPDDSSMKLVWLWETRDVAGLDNVAVGSSETGKFTVSADVTGVGYGADDTLAVKVAWGRDATNLLYTNDVATATKRGETVEASIAAKVMPGLKHYVKVFALDKDGALAWEGKTVGVVVLCDIMNGDPGLIQAKYSSAWYTGSWDIRNADDAKTVLAPWAAHSGSRVSGSEPWRSSDGRETYQWGDNQTWGYVGYMWFDAVTYTFGGCMDDNVSLKIGDGLYTFTESGSSMKTGSWTCPAADWYPIEIRVGNGSGGRGPYAEMSYGGLAWNTTGTIDPSHSSWNKFVDSGDGSLLRTFAGKVQGAERLVIASDSAEFGKADPAYGEYCGIPAGTTFDCFAPAGISDETAQLSCRGWILYTNATDNAETWIEWKRGDGAVLDYTHPEGTAAKLEWQIEAKFKATVSAADGGQVAIDGGEPTGFWSDWIDAGEVHTVVPVVPDGASFVCWQGNMAAEQEDDTPLSLTMEGPKTVTAHFAAGTVARWRGSDSNNRASVASNWADGVLPVDGATIILGCGAMDMTWDLSSVTPSQWRQTANYNKTVTFQTTFEGKGYSVLNIAGDVMLESGVWKHSVTSSYNQNDDPNSVYRISVAATGDFTVGPNAKIDVMGCGYPDHRYGSDSNVLFYGSIVCPTNYGMASHRQSAPGAVKLVVGGEFRLDGLVSASSEQPNESSDLAASGGSIWITAGTMSGSGAIKANGGYTTRNANKTNVGSGGRISLMLTKPGADFSDFHAKVTAWGAIIPGSGHSMYAKTGTVYWQTGDEQLGHGTVVVANDPESLVSEADLSPNTWLLPQQWCDSNELKYAKLVIGAKSGVTLTGDLEVRDLVLEDETSALDLAGYKLRVHSAFHPYPTKHVTNAGEATKNGNNFKNIVWNTGIVIFFH